MILHYKMAYSVTYYMELYYKFYLWIIQQICVGLMTILQLGRAWDTSFVFDSPNFLMVQVADQVYDILHRHCGRVQASIKGYLHQ